MIMKRQDQSQSNNFSIPHRILCLWNGSFSDLHFFLTFLNNYTATTRQFTLKPPVDLHEIGYNGTWEPFCNIDEINKDSPPFPEHELRILRLEICHRHQLNKFTPLSKDIFAEYLYCVTNRTEADELLEKLIDKLSEDDAEKRSKLFALGVPKWVSGCVRQCQEDLRIRCIDRFNPYYRMFFALISKACTQPWLPEPKIRQVIREECEGKRIPMVHIDDILLNINYREE